MSDGIQIRSAAAELLGDSVPSSVTAAPTPEQKQLTPTEKFQDAIKWVHSEIESKYPDGQKKHLRSAYDHAELMPPQERILAKAAIAACASKCDGPFGYRVAETWLEDVMAQPAGEARLKAALASIKDNPYFGELKRSARSGESGNFFRVGEFGNSLPFMAAEVLFQNREARQSGEARLDVLKVAVEHAYYGAHVTRAAIEADRLRVLLGSKYSELDSSTKAESDEESRISKLKSDISGAFLREVSLLPQGKPQLDAILFLGPYEPFLAGNRILDGVPIIKTPEARIGTIMQVQFWVRGANTIVHHVTPNIDFDRRIVQMLATEGDHLKDHNTRSQHPEYHDGVYSLVPSLDAAPAGAARDAVADLITRLGNRKTGEAVKARMTELEAPTKPVRDIDFPGTALQA